MKGLWSILSDIVASNGAAVTMITLVAAAFVFVILTGMAARVVLLLESRRGV